MPHDTGPARLCQSRGQLPLTVSAVVAIREFGGIPVAFIGLTLKGTPNLVAPTGVADLEFRDEADTVSLLQQLGAFGRGRALTEARIRATV